MKHIIKNIDDAKAFVNACIAQIGHGFHPDNLFQDYINLETKERLFTAKEARTYNRALKYTFNHFGEANEDIYDYAYNIISDDFEFFKIKYAPVKNHIDKNASFFGYMFETFDDDIKHINHILATKGDKYVWTICHGEKSNMYLTNGCWLCNRIGYIVTEIPFIEERGAIEFTI